MISAAAFELNRVTRFWDLLLVIHEQTNEGIRLI